MTQVTLKEGDAAFIVRANGDTELLLPKDEEATASEDCVVLVAVASKWDDDRFREEMEQHFDLISEESDNSMLGEAQIFTFPGNKTIN